jgi:hypothetical protein
MVKFPYSPTSCLKAIEDISPLNEIATKNIVQSKNLHSNLSLRINDERSKKSPSRSSRIKLPILEQKRNLIDDAKAENLFDEHTSFDNKKSSKAKQTSSKKKTTLKDKIRDFIESPLVSLNDIKKRYVLISTHLIINTHIKIKKYLISLNFYYNIVSYLYKINHFIF